MYLVNSSEQLISGGPPASGLGRGERLAFYEPFAVLRNQKGIHEESKSRFNSENACYHSVQNLLSSSLLSRSVKINSYKTLILPVVLYWRKT
jgi:hypothetical protein